MVVTLARRQLIIAQYYVNERFASHQGIIRTVSLLRNRFYWIWLTSDVANYIRACSTCQRSKNLPNVSILLNSIAPGRSWFECISLDLYGFGALPAYGSFRGILTVVDNFSNFIQMYPLPLKLPPMFS